MLWELQAYSCRYTTEGSFQPDLVVGALYAKEVVFEVATSLGKLQQIIIREEGPVNVGHDGARQVCSRRLQHVQDGSRGPLISAGMNNERCPCIRETYADIGILCMCIRKVNSACVSNIHIHLYMYMYTRGYFVLLIVQLSRQLKVQEALSKKDDMGQSVQMSTCITISKARDLCDKYVDKYTYELLTLGAHAQRGLQ